MSRVINRIRVPFLMTSDSDEEIVEEVNEPPKLIKIKETVEKQPSSSTPEPKIPMPSPPPIIPRTVIKEPVQPIPVSPPEIVNNYRTTQQPQTTHNIQRRIVSNTGGPSILAAYLLWFFLGWAGIHHLYMGRGVGGWILSILSFQGWGIWWIVDIFLIPSSCTKVRQSTVIIA